MVTQMAVDVCEIALSAEGGGARSLEKSFSTSKVSSDRSREFSTPRKKAGFFRGFLRGFLREFFCGFFREFSVGSYLIWPVDSLRGFCVNFSSMVFL